MGAIVVTGAAGFVGRHLIAALAAAGERIVAIDRVNAPPALASSAQWVAGDLRTPSSYGAALTGADCVIHLAALTGKARPSAFRRINVDATKTLLEASTRAGIRRFVLMSSIAVTFAPRADYPYAESKRAAEGAVQASGIDWTIVRPTMIMGPGSPIEMSLARLAHLPVTPVFGAGRVRIEPIDVTDVARFLAGACRDTSASRQIIELGGPQAFTMLELLSRLKGRPARFAHVPLGLTRGVLGLAEAPLLPLLPFTAGQLATFANDSVAAPHPLIAKHAPERKPSPAPGRA